MGSWLVNFVPMGIQILLFILFLVAKDYLQCSGSLQLLSLSAQAAHNGSARCECSLFSRNDCADVINLTVFLSPASCCWFKVSVVMESICCICYLHFIVCCGPEHQQPPPLPWHNTLAASTAQLCTIPSYLHTQVSAIWNYLQIIQTVTCISSLWWKRLVLIHINMTEKF